MICLMPKLVTDIPRVAILLPTAIKTCREMLQGVLRYVRQRGPWAVQIVEGREDEQKILDFKAWGCTGVIGNLGDRFFARRLPPIRVPVVLTNPTNTAYAGKAGRPVCGLRRVVATVSCENAPIGQAAAAYFLERGFRRFAYVGEIHDAEWSVVRCKAFAAAVQLAGFACAEYRIAPEAVRRDAAREHVVLEGWLHRLPKPSALFVANDARGRQVLDACMRARIAVPQDLSILSCDNDEMVCETAIPQLSSIRMDPEQAGFKAAELLARAMRGELASRRPKIRISYGFAGIVTRQSSASLRAQDPLVERALSFIRLNANLVYSVEDLADSLNVSRRLLELHFRNVLKRTVHAEIMRVRMERVQAFLRDTTDTVEAIASTCGFASASHLCAAFKRLVGVTPSTYRQTTPRIYA